MKNRLLAFFRGAKPAQPEADDQERRETRNAFRSPLTAKADNDLIRETLPFIFQRTAANIASVGADGIRAASMDESLRSCGLSPLPNIHCVQNTLPALVLQWFGAHSFIGHQACAILAQHWLIDKVCSRPPKDAIQNGYKIVLSGVDKEQGQGIVDRVTEINKGWMAKNTSSMASDAGLGRGMLRQCYEFARFARIFGIRHALFLIDGIDYAAPFNPDGIAPGSYKGISQIDPYWLTPEFDTQSIADPASPTFYEPTWWRLPNGNRVHRTHFVILREGEVADVLKPTYYYGGNPLPQQIYERVYAAERTANEAPELAMTKRLTVMQGAIENYLSDENEVTERLEAFNRMRSNHGVIVVGEDENLSQSDTSLTDFDALIMTQYQLCAAIGRMPATKLLETSPKGFNATGEHESDSYDQELVSIQTDGMDPLMDRHHLCLARSEFPEFPELAIATEWEPVRAPKPGEVADINLKNAQAGQLRITSGVISPEDEREKVKADPHAGYPNLADREDVEPGPDAMTAFLESLGAGDGGNLGEGWQG